MADEEAGALRLDLALVGRGLYETRSKAQAAIRDGLVKVGGILATRAAAIVTPEITIDAVSDAYVSRSALKLKAALAHFNLSPAGCIALDIGASTGGFTQVLLEHGAARVIAVDVGADQLRPNLKHDPRVVSLEKRDARTLTNTDVPVDTAFLVCDVSFIGATKALDKPLDLLAVNAVVVVLVKPQFEVGPDRVGKGGIVKDSAAQRESVEAVIAYLAHKGFREIGHIKSPILGGDGNTEFLVAAIRETA